MKKYAYLISFLLIYLTSITLYSADDFKNIRPFNHSLDTPTRGWKVTQILHESYYHSSNEWINSAKMVYYYNILHPANIDSIQAYGIDSTNTWKQRYCEIYAYDENQNVIEKTSYAIYWYQNDIRQPDHRYIYEYDEQSNLINYSTYIWSGFGYWEAEYTSHIEYINNNVYLTSYMDTNDLDYYYFEELCSYDSMGRIIRYDTDSSNNSINWVDYSQKVLTYISGSTYSVKSKLYNFTNDLATTGVENSNRNFLVSHISYDEYLSWGTDYETDITYNELSQKISSVSEIWLEGSYHYFITRLYSYDTEGNLTMELSGDNRTTYSWAQENSNEDTVLPSVSDLNVSAYPNPFHSNLNMKTKTNSTEPVRFEIFNIRGQKVYSVLGIPNANFNWDSKEISNGVYFLTATQGNSSITKKLLRLK